MMHYQSIATNGLNSTKNLNKGMLISGASLSDSPKVGGNTQSGEVYKNFFEPGDLEESHVLNIETTHD